jgi:hypothetical protein
LALLTAQVAPLPPPPPPLPPPPPPPPDPTLQTLDQADDLRLKAGEAVQALDHLKQRLVGHDDLELTLSWRLQRRTRGH